MRRRRDDRVKPGRGIDGTLGERFAKTNVTSTWGDYVGKIDPASSMPAADQNRDVQFMWGSRQIWADVEENQDTVDTPHNRITAGVNRAQDDRD